jgi:hypothetical protein
MGRCTYETLPSDRKVHSGASTEVGEVFAQQPGVNLLILPVHDGLGSCSWGES